MKPLVHLSSGAGHLGAKLQPGGEWHDRFWGGIERADQTLDSFYEWLGRNCDVAALALLGGILSVITLVAFG